MAGQLLPCRFDAEHGSFGSPIQLGRHYREAHPDYLANDTRVKCEVKGCYAKVTPKNLPKHMADNHSGKALVPVKKPKAVKPDWHPDQIVMPVIAELYGESIPRDKLLSVFAFRDATERLIEEAKE